jgi:Mg-chelatase subunit ChlD
MLPVDSEALDPTRRVDVAEVLLIDTSESMGACHCTNGVTVDRRGVVKTDIAKAGAINAFQALIATDEFGVLAFTGTPRWVLPLGEGYSLTTVEGEIGTLRPVGDTRIKPALIEAAEALRSSEKDLKHMILFTDGFTNELLGGFGAPGPIEGGADDIYALVADLAEEGITISVVATGEGALEELERLAIAGRGRFYPGRDLDEIPEIFINESRLASRTYINEGEFFPTVTSSATPVADLDSAPPVLGYVAATPRPTADVLLRVGALGDPLLASWTLGLGRVTAWTSDAGYRWAAPWAEWDGFTEFWSDVVRETFPLAGAEGQRVRATITEGVMSITLEGAEPWPAGTAPQARIRRPDGTHAETRLTRVSDHEFVGTIPALEDGIYSVGVGFDRGDGEVAILSAIASRSFSAEFLPGPPDTTLMAGISSSTGGRGEITPEQAFDPDGLADGVVNRSLRWWFLFAAALLWPVDVALRRMRPRRRGRRTRRWPARRLLPTPTRP